MAMEWSDLRIFLAVARTGSLSAAAHQLGLTQPTMGRRVRALEEEIGHALFQRGREGFQLTDEGTTVLGHALRMEDEAIAIERQLSGQDVDNADGLHGSLRISASDWFGCHVLAPVCAEMLRRHPAVQLELVTDARLYDLARREADLVFRIRALDSAEVVQRKLLHMDYALYGPASLACPTVGDGGGANLITLDRAFEDLPDVAWLTHTFPHARRVFGSNNRDAQAQLCALGAGFAVLPRLLGDHVPGLVRHDLAPPPPGRDVWLAYHQDLRGLARLRAFVDLAVEMIAGAMSNAVSRDA